MERSNASLPAATQTIEEILRCWPGTAATLRRAGLGDCVGCAMAAFETVEEAARTYGLDPKRILTSLRTAAKKGGR